MIDVFASAEEVAVKPKTGVLRTIVPVIAGLVTVSEFVPQGKGYKKQETEIDKVARLQQVRDAIKELEAEEAMLLADLKPLAEEKFLSMYKQDKNKPENFVLQGEKGGQLMVIVQDSYNKPTATMLQAVKQLYPEQVSEIIKEDKGYKFNASLLAQYQPVIAKAIGAIPDKDFPAADKKKLIQADVKQTVQKGLIGKLMTFEQPEQLFGVVRPTIQFKNQKEAE